MLAVQATDESPKNAWRTSTEDNVSGDYETRLQNGKSTQSRPQSTSASAAASSPHCEHLDDLRGEQVHRFKWQASPDAENNSGSAFWTCREKLTSVLLLGERERNALKLRKFIFNFKKMSIKKSLKKLKSTEFILPKNGSCF